MDWEIFRPRPATLVCIVLLLFSFLLMTFRMSRAVEALRSFLYYWTSPVQETATTTVEMANEVGFKRLAELVRAHQENKILTEKVKNLALLEANYRQTQTENERLRRLLQLSDSVPFRVIPAFVSGRDSQNWVQSLWLDRGVKEGVLPDSPVLSFEVSASTDSYVVRGVVGRILESGSSSSKVLLISDPLSSIAVSLPRTGEQGLAQGQGHFSVQVEYLEPGADIRVGDEVVTSGFGGIFPPGLPLGVLTEIATSPSGFKRARIQPYVWLNKVREVLVLRKQESHPLSAAKKTNP